MNDRPVEIGFATWPNGAAPHQCRAGTAAYMGSTLGVHVFASGARRFGCVCGWFRWEAA